MKIEYKFVDGTVTEIEVDGSLSEFMLELKNEGDRVERKETRRHVLLSAVDPEDRYFDSGRDTPEETARKDELERLAAAIGRLQPQQRELLRRIYWNGEKQKDIAAEDGVSERAITGRMKKIYAQNAKNPPTFAQKKQEKWAWYSTIVIESEKWAFLTN